jgi:hypothetical protein
MVHFDLWESYVFNVLRWVYIYAVIYIPKPIRTNSV